MLVQHKVQHTLHKLIALWNPLLSLHTTMILTHDPSQHNVKYACTHTRAHGTCFPTQGERDTSPTSPVQGLKDVTNPRAPGAKPPPLSNTYPRIARSSWAAAAPVYSPPLAMGRTSPTRRAQTSRAAWGAYPGTAGANGTQPGEGMPGTMPEDLEVFEVGAAVDI